MQFYDRALRVCSAIKQRETNESLSSKLQQLATIHLNKAAVYLDLKRFHEAYTEAEAALGIKEAVIDEEKALYRFLFTAILCIILRTHFCRYFLRS